MEATRITRRYSIVPVRPEGFKGTCEIVERPVVALADFDSARVRGFRFFRRRKV